MTTPKQMEPNVNNALGNLLKGMMSTCTVLAENTQTFTDHPGRHADVLVTATGRSPVVVEAEFEPAPEAEKGRPGKAWPEGKRRATGHRSLPWPCAIPAAAGKGLRPFFKALSGSSPCPIASCHEDEYSGSRNRVGCRVRWRTWLT